MDKYEYRVKTEQMLEYMEKKQYKKAMEIADTVDWRRVKNATMLNTVSEIYEYNGEIQKSRDILLVALDRSPSSRKLVYRLAALALKLQDTEEASDCYEEFVKLAPKDPNQYILKYRILKAQGSSITEQIAALEDFKKAEYIEKWAYELAKLYHEAGMTAECLEECDDLILWFSEGKYVYQAMELKMKYKPLTPLQQEKYDRYKGVKRPQVKRPEQVSRRGALPKATAVAQDTIAFSQEQVFQMESNRDNNEQESIAADATRRIPTEDLSKALEEMEAKMAGDAPAEPEAEEENVPETKSSITTVVKGATLKEALANGVAIASGINREEQRKMEQREEEIRIAGQMKIEDILLEWEEKQKANADAIEKQRAEDEERLRKEREAVEARREAERLEAERREAEEVERRRAEEAARLAAEEAARREAEEAARREAEEAAKREAEEAARREAEEAAKREAEEAARREAEEAAKREAEEAARREAEEAAKREAEEAARREAEETARREAEEAARLEAEETARREAEEAAKHKEKMAAARTPILSDDIRQLVEELEGRVAEDDDAEDDFDIEEELELAKAEGDSVQEDADVVENFVDADVFGEKYEIGEQLNFDEVFEELADEDVSPAAEEYDESDFAEDNLENGDYAEDDFAEDDFADEEYDEDDFDDEEYDEDDFDDEEYDEDDFGEDDFDDEGYDEDDFDDDDYDEDDFDEDDFDDDDYDEDDFDEDDFDEDEFEEAGFDEDEFDEDDFGNDDELPEIAAPDFDEEELEIEEPSEEEIQERIKKSKGSGVPFDTGFVVTGRYDLSATSEIGLKAGLTEEQKKLFSYFVPVRGMSEQIVSVLDNDRRAQREGTSKTGNLLVIGRQGSGKTVLAVDIVKAIQKQRNLKQGKVAIVTGESLNKKELTNIIQKLRGGAIIIEKAGKLNSRTIKELNMLMEKKTGEMLFVLEDQRKPLERILTANPEFKKKFTSRLELPVFINDELVTFGQTYAKENGYKLDEMGILALYSRIDVMQREDHAVTVAEVKDIMDEAIEHSQKANVKHLARRVFGKSTDSSDRIILKEEDFKI